MKRNLIKTAKHVFEYLIYAIPLLIIFETHLCANPLVKGNFYHNIKKSNGISVKLLERDQEQMTLKTVDVTVTGSVVDHNGEPFPGVTISVPGTGIGTATDLDGRYTISVPEGSTLVFSFIGFDSQTITD